MPGLNPIVGRTEAEAKEKHAYLQSLIHPEVGLELLSNAVDGFDLRPFPLDGPLPEAVDATYKKGSTTAFKNVLRWAREEKLTIRQLYHALRRRARTAHADRHGRSRSSTRWRTGSSPTRATAFWSSRPTFPAGFDDFVALVIPELQERGLFRTEYEGPTLARSARLAAAQKPVRGTPDIRATGGAACQPASCHSLNLAHFLARFAAHQASSLMNTLSLSFGLVGRMSRMSAGTSLSASVFGIGVVRKLHVLRVGLAVY